MAVAREPLEHKSPQSHHDGILITEGQVKEERGQTPVALSLEEYSCFGETTRKPLSQRQSIKPAHSITGFPLAKRDILRRENEGPALIHS